ncbi:ClpXP protease specificity-enhancing factor [Aliidiomarina sp. B3213]|nr:ClpXP protease specificity-enhancing factor [Aliidiomarina sp. B3213]
MTPKRPYLVRALYEWLLDNQMTPHIVIDANWPGAEVPQEFVQDGQIVLNVHPEATTAFEMGDFDVRFQARFGGVPRKVVAPYGSLLAIYARENGAGSIFEPEQAYDDPEAQYPESGRDVELAPVPDDAGESKLGQGKSESDDGDGDEPTPPPRGKPTLKVIK